MVHLLVKVFAKPIEEQEEEIFFYSMMFLVIAGGSAITLSISVCNTVNACCHLFKNRLNRC